MDMIARLIREYPPPRSIACWDDDWRLTSVWTCCPVTKSNRVARQTRRKSPRRLLQEQIPLIEALLVAVGIPKVGMPG